MDGYFIYILYIYIYRYVSNTPAVSSIDLRVDAHLCKLRDTPVAHFYKMYYSLKAYYSPSRCCLVKQDTLTKGVFGPWSVNYNIVNTSAVTSTKFTIDTHHCKLRDTPTARFFGCVIL